MHELGVVFHCIKEINQIALENKVKKIASVTIELGEVSTVIPDLFEDCWNWAVKKEDILHNAKIVIEKIKAITHCEQCGENYDTVTNGKTCPKCGSLNTYLLTGNEIIIKQIEVRE